MSTKHYPDIEPNPNFAALEQEILTFWASDHTFENSVEMRASAKADGSSNSYVFYDGPPFANGLPHYGHLLTGYVKDAIARYHTMRGSRVERRFGWDCHGLPAEMGAEKDLGISGRAAITNYGIDKFNAHCRANVDNYREDWRYYVTRQGRWVDFDNDYKTMDTSFMESVLWAFKQLYDKGLVYESMRVMPYSWAAETPLSNFETRLDNATREREDKSAYVKFKLNGKPAGAPEAKTYYAVAWTTTPWTLPANLALAVNVEHDYFPIVVDDACYLLGWSALKNLWSTIVPAKRLETSRCYLRPFTEDDFELLKALHNHPDVAATTYDGVQPDEKIREQLNDIIAQHNKYGFSQWAVFEKGTDKFIGRAGLTLRKLDPDRPPQWELRRALHSAFWNGGIGTELARLSLAVGFGMLKVPMLAAGTMPNSEKAEYLQRKIGFVYEKEIPVPGNQIGKYCTMSEEQFLAANAIKGAALVGLTYEPLFPYFAKMEGAFRVLDGTEFVTEGDGTGIVHMAPGFGEVDQKVCEKNGIEVIVPVDGQGKYTDAIYDLPDLQLHGLNVIAETRLETSDLAQHINDKDVAKFGLANMRIVRWLKTHGKLVKDEVIKHNYPHCWRTDTPLIYRAMPSWYVEVTKFRDRAVEINKQIAWVPEHIRDGQMAHMLATAPDWSISRNRFWGTPIPVWRSKTGKIKVFGSIAEIEAASGQKVADLHRPIIDDIVIHEGGEEFRRVEDVFDCWFESGSMPFAQLHYPFENKKLFEENFPANFITEYVGQTRGWFNTLIMLSTALFDKPPFLNCICHGVVLDLETGLKYSKRLKNYKDPKEVMDSFGADALRWLMLASPVMRGADLSVDPDGKFIRDVVRLNIKPMWSAFNFFTLYANADGVKAKSITSSENMLDRYILAKARAAVEQVRASLDAYDTPGAAEAITAFFDVLNNWYIRRSRPRFWGEEVSADKQAAYDTLFTVLNLMCLTAAPLLPFVAEAVYRGLNGKETSVHLQDFPDVSGIDAANELVAKMDWVKDICNAASSIRNRQNIRNRQPLNALNLYGNKLLLEFVKGGPHELVKEWNVFHDIIADEVNVKSVVTISSQEKFEATATYKLQINSAVLGKRLPEKMKQILPASKKGEWKILADGSIEIAGEKLLEGEFTIHLEPKLEFKDSSAPLSTNDALVVLDLTITPELEAEGRARDLVRMIQQARKDAGLHVADRITLALDVPPDFKAALATHGDYIAEQTLAVSWSEGSASAAQQMKQELDGEQFVIGISKAA